MNRRKEARNEKWAGFDEKSLRPIKSSMQGRIHCCAITFMVVLVTFCLLEKAPT
jgi:hypothetical protein